MNRNGSRRRRRVVKRVRCHWIYFRKRLECASRRLVKQYLIFFIFSYLTCKVSHKKSCVREDRRVEVSAVGFRYEGYLKRLHKTYRNDPKISQPTRHLIPHDNALHPKDVGAFFSCLREDRKFSYPKRQRSPGDRVFSPTDRL